MSRKSKTAETVVRIRFLDDDAIRAASAGAATTSHSIHSEPILTRITPVGITEDAKHREAEVRLNAGAQRTKETGQGAATPKQIRDAATESRNQHIYDELCKGTLEDVIVRQIKAHPGWGRMARQGLRPAAIRHAARHGMERPPARKRGRPPKKQ